MHLGVDVEAGVAELCDFLGEEFDAVDGVAEDDALVDFEFGEECVEAVDLLALLDEGVELRDALQSQVVHQVDLVRVRNELVLEIFHRDGKRRLSRLFIWSLVSGSPI